jgi:hypothetical protein
MLFDPNIFSLPTFAERTLGGIDPTTMAQEPKFQLPWLPIKTVKLNVSFSFDKFY